MFAQEDIDEARRAPTLGPSYFDARRVAEQFVIKFRAEQFKPIVDTLATEVADRLQNDLDTYLLENAEMNLQAELYRMVDYTINALLGGEQWALQRYGLAARYNDGGKIREAVAKHIPKELQDVRIADLQEEVERLRKDAAIRERSW